MKRTEESHSDIDEFAETFLNEHPALDHELADMLEHLRKEKQLIQQSLGELTGYSEKRLAEVSQQLRDKLEDIEVRIAAAIAKF